MSPLMLALCAVVGIILLVAAVKKSQSSGLPAISSPLSLSPAIESIRVRSQWEVETDEDLQVISEVYRDNRRSARAQAALERLGAITSATAKK